MELFKSILIKILEESEIKIADVDRVIESRCYKALKEIIRIVRTPDLEDKECFMRIENIVAQLESLGIDCGSRHDFG